MEWNEIAVNCQPANKQLTIQLPSYADAKAIFTEMALRLKDQTPEELKAIGEAIRMSGSLKS